MVSEVLLLLLLVVVSAGVVVVSVVVEDAMVSVGSAVGTSVVGPVGEALVVIFTEAGSSSGTTISHPANPLAPSSPSDKTPSQTPNTDLAPPGTSAKSRPLHAENEGTVTAPLLTKSSLAANRRR